MPEATQDASLLQELRRTLGRLEAALGTISDALVITRASGQILWCNRSFQALCGLSNLQLLGQPLQVVLPLDHAGAPLLNLADLNLQQPQASTSTVFLSRDPLVALEIEWNPVDSENPPPLIFCFRDVSSRITNLELQRQVDRAERRRRESESRNAELQEQQLTLAAKVVECPVTGLPNRRGLQTRMAEALASLSQQPGLVSILFCDLNGFKEINDLYGHQVGDELLVEIGRRLQRVLGPGDTLARLGGDEFVVLTHGQLQTIDPLKLAMRLQLELGAPWLVEDQWIRPSMSVGIASTNDPGMAIDELLRRADLAMYDAKAKGEIHISHYEASIDHRVKGTIVLRRRLRQAIDDNELFLEYQPIIKLSDQELVAQESLVRIRSATSASLMPGNFIPMAERTGLILPMGRWVIREALTYLRQLQQAGQLLITSINVSPLQLKQEDFAAAFLNEAERLEIDPRWIAIEVTESMLIDQPEQTSRELRRLRSSGVQVYLDDFGTGYSSMAWLARLPIDAIKIDSSFTADFLSHPRKATVLQSMINLARDLQVSMIAEGIETKEQYLALLAMGCQLGQGYYFGRPQPARSPAAPPPAA